MIPNIYLSDEQIAETKHKAYRHESRLSPAAFNMFGRDQCVAKAAADNAVKQVQTIENPFEGYFDAFENIRMAKSQGFERFREALKKLALDK